MKRTLSVILSLTLLLTLCVPALAADSAVGSTLRLEETSGTVTVKTSAGQSKSVVKSMRLYNGYTIETGASSSAFISLDDARAVKLDANTKVEIAKSGKKLEVSLTAGNLIFDVRQPLAADESLNVRTTTCITGIRGSFGWVGLNDVALMEGHAGVTVPGANGWSVSRPLANGERVVIPEDGGAPVGAPITAADVPAFVVEAIMNDPALQAKIAAAMPTLDIAALIKSLPEKQAREAAAEKAAQQAADAALAAQNAAIAAEGEPKPVYTAAQPEKTPEEIAAERAARAEAREQRRQERQQQQAAQPQPQPMVFTALPSDQNLQTALNDTQYSIVRIPTVSAGNAPHQDYEDLNIPAGKTLEIYQINNLAQGSAYDAPSFTNLTNAGTLVIESGVRGTNNEYVTFSALNNRGTIEIGGNGAQVTLKLSAGASNNNSGTIKNEGTITLQSGGAASSGTLTNTGTINNDGTILIDGGATLANAAGATLTSSNAITLQSGGQLTNSGTLTIGGATGLVVTSSGGTITNTGAGKITVNSTLSLQGGTFNNSATLTIESSTDTQHGLFIYAGVTLTNTGTITNKGKIDNDSNNVTNSGTITNNGTFTNSGTITNSGSGAIVGAVTNINNGSVVNPQP